MRTWYVADESTDRPGFCCLAIRETESQRLICDLADEPLDYPACVERSHREARLIAKAPALLEMLRRLVDAAETKDEPDCADGTLYRETVRETYALLDQLKGIDDPK